MSAAATIITFITGILFFTVGKPFGKINDISSVFQMLFMFPMAIGLALVLPESIKTLGVLVTITGVVGMTITTIGQSLLVFGKIDFSTSMKFFPAGAVIGLWLIAISWLIGIGGLLPQPLIWIGILAGLGYLITVSGFLIFGQEHWLFYIGGLILGIVYPIWAIWLGCVFATGS